MSQQTVVTFPSLHSLPGAQKATQAEQRKESVSNFRAIVCISKKKNALKNNYEKKVSSNSDYFLLITVIQAEGSGCGGLGLHCQLVSGPRDALGAPRNRAHLPSSQTGFKGSHLRSSPPGSLPPWAASVLPSPYLAPPPALTLQHLQGPLWPSVELGRMAAKGRQRLEPKSRFWPQSPAASTRPQQTPPVSPVCLVSRNRRTVETRKSRENEDEIII